MRTRRMSPAALVLLGSVVLVSLTTAAPQRSKEISLALSLTAVSPEEAASLAQKVRASVEATSPGGRPLVQLRHRPLSAGALVPRAPESEQPTSPALPPPAPQSGRRAARPRPAPASEVPALLPEAREQDLSRQLMEDARRALDKTRPVLPGKEPGDLRPDRPILRGADRLHARPDQRRGPERTFSKKGASPPGKAPGPGTGPGEGPPGQRMPPPPPPPPGLPGPGPH